MKSITSAFLQIFKKAPLNKSLGIHKNGSDNLYPEYIENIISESVTAFRCSRLMSSYIIGKGFGEETNKIIINENKGTSLFRFGMDISDSIADHKGVWIHVNYNIEGKFINFDVLPFTDCRLGKKDNNSYSGKIHLCEDWSDGKKAKKATKIDVFNPDPVVVRSQIEKAKGLSKYKGQIFYYKAGKMTYPLSPLHPSRNDADSEKQASTYKNRSLKKGFFGKTLVVTKPLVDSDLKDTDGKTYQSQLTEREDFRKTLQQFIGAENVDGVLHVELDFESDKIEEEILFKNIDSNINDKLFAFTESSVRNNIRMAFNNVPAPLIESADGKLFGSSGEAIREMKKFYQDQTELERIQTEEIANIFAKGYKDEIPILKIIPLIEEEITAPEPKKP